MSRHPQTQSAFVTRLVALPPETRDAIYLEMWRSCGFSQHIIWHGQGADMHFCSWPCTTEYEVDDGLQREAEEVRRRLGISLGEDMGSYGIARDYEVTALNRRLQSPWMNHWACGERAWQEHGLKAVWGFSTSEVVCWRKNQADKKKEHVPSWSPYLPMLLSCKLLYVSKFSLHSLCQASARFTHSVWL